MQVFRVSQALCRCGGVHLADATARFHPLSGSAALPRGWSEHDLAFMRQALALAERAAREDDEVPVGAVLVGADGTVLGEGWNRNIGQHDPTAHAEVVALRAAGTRLRNYRLPGTTLYVTLEPCAMCAMAIVHARLGRVVYAAADPRTGAAGSVFDLLVSERHNHRVQVEGGLLAEQSSTLLTGWFRARRGAGRPGRAPAA